MASTFAGEIWKLYILCHGMAPPDRQAPVAANRPVNYPDPPPTNLLAGKYIYAESQLFNQKIYLPNSRPSADLFADSKLLGQ